MTTNVYKSRRYIRRICIGALCLAAAMVLPFVTGAIPQIGKLLCPMHIPVFLAGALGGPIVGGAVGFLAPLVRGLTLGTPIIFPTGISMSFELLAYGISFGILVRSLPKKYGLLYPALIISMVVGRVVGGAGKVVLYTAGFIEDFGFSIFLTGYFVQTLPAVIVQLILIPPVVYALNKLKIMGN